MGMMNSDTIKTASEMVKNNPNMLNQAQQAR